MFRKPKRKIYFLIFVLPTLAAFLIGFVYPFFNGIYLSFCKFRTTSDAVFIGFGNYVKAFQNEGFLHSFWFTVLFVIVSVILINLIAFLWRMHSRSESGVQMYSELFSLFLTL